MIQKGTITIAITGPESSGKSTLVEALASQLPNARSVSEYARNYLTQHNKIKADHVEEIAQIWEMQCREWKQQQLKQPRYLLLDTDDLVIQIWMQEVFGTEAHAWKESHKACTIDFTLLCSPDLPWKPDPLRANPNDRDRLFQLFIQELEANGRSYACIRGLGEQRLQSALDALKDHGLLF
jgi:NadR type nicotinamide-nucleotide adenylyltransferase